MKNLPELRQAAASELLKRRRARKDLHSFITYLNKEYIVSDFSRTVCKLLDEFLIDMMDGKRPILVLGAPPQHGKTEIVSRNFPAYVLGKYPDLKIGGLSYAFPLATSINRDVQRIMMSPEYANIFPHSTLNPKRVVTIESEAKRNASGFEIMGAKGSYLGQGVGGPLTGMRLDLGTIDDPTKNAAEARSETVKDGIWNWYTSTFLTRLSKNSGQIIMATRWAIDDLSGRIIKKYKRAKVVNFKAIDEEGKALIPELHPLEKLEETKETLGDYYWSALYQQNPIPISGGIIKPYKIELIDALPAGLKYVRGWDLAATKDDGDYTVGIKMAIKDGVTYIAGMERDRGAPDEVEALLLSTAHRDIGDTKQSIAQDPGQAGKAQVKYLSKKLKGINFEFSPESGDKLTRAMPFISQVNVGNVKMVRANWNDDLIEEFKNIPAGSHDDILDACSRAYNSLLGKPGSFLTRRR